MAKFFSQDVLGVDFRRMFPFATFVLVNFGGGDLTPTFAKVDQTSQMETFF